MASIVIIPGIGGSGPDHWQSLWQEDMSDVLRFQPADWDRPNLTDWMAALDHALSGLTAPPVLVAHSLGCLLVAHWAASRKTPVRGAFLVAVPDPKGPAFPREAASFADAPTSVLPFPSRIVASSNDPYGSLDHMTACAAAWGSDLVEVGALGHINGASGLGGWAQGRALFEAFCLMPV